MIEIPWEEFYEEVLGKETLSRELTIFRDEIEEGKHWEREEIVIYHDEEDDAVYVVTYNKKSDWLDGYNHRVYKI